MSKPALEDDAPSLLIATGLGFLTGILGNLLGRPLALGRWCLTCMTPYRPSHGGCTGADLSVLFRTVPLLAVLLLPVAIVVDLVLLPVALVVFVATGGGPRPR